MKLIIIRHGESEADILKVLEGRADYPLTERGRNQAISASKWICNHEEIDRIISSPLKRAKETAEIIGKQMNLKVEFNDMLMEWDNGLLAGLSRDEADRLYPIPEGGKKPHHEIANSESLINFRGRAESFLSHLKEEANDDVLLVTHGGMINMIFQSLMNLPMLSNVVVGSDDTAIHKFELDGTKVFIEYMNSVEHLTNVDTEES